MIIAIDGTTASGKGTIARRLAAHYGLPHMDTGRLYRAVGVAALRSSVALDDPLQLAEIAVTLDPDRFSEAELRSVQAGKAASVVAAFPEVRSALRNLQRNFATQPGGAILDGRDIGTVIAPDADAKLWIDAGIAQRADRRWKELVRGGATISLDEVREQLAIRDARDQGRRDAPAIMATDAILIDTSELTIDAAVERAMAAVEAAIARGKTG